MSDIKPLLGLLFFVWGGVYFYHLVVYSLGDKKHINQLVDNLAKEPQRFKSINDIAMNSVGAGGLFSYFCLIYPFIRHRRREKKRSFDVFMGLNWVFFMTILYVSVFV
ncbi:hypothetical protein [Vibrio sp. T11.5]|uniref:hypothetical protein n=1 Tax=Vibrio sp. T11.5 TaxID=2998836 RepID=UPI0022CD8F5C|nr:hypothetical protein [Vibrio sp. T11.5]MDA0116910.1 hypothetical protein [Vibrio sp. T11.5]